MDLAEVLAGRAGLAGIQGILSGGQARRVLRSTLEGLLSNASLGSCRIRRAKYKTDRYLNAYFDVTLRRQDGVPEEKDQSLDSKIPEIIRPIAVTWSFQESLGQAQTSPDAFDLQAEALSRGLAAPFRELSGEAPVWSMKILVSPMDVYFPQLVRLSDPKYVGEMLAESFAGKMGVRENAIPFQCSITPIRYRPGQRHVLRYEAMAEGKNGGSKTFFAKLYDDQREGVRAYQTAIQVCDWLDVHGGGVIGTRPLLYHEDDGVILYPKAPGVPLSRLLKKSGRKLGPSLRLAGSALRSLHELPISTVGSLGLERKTFADEVRTVTHASDHLRALLPEARVKVEMILDRAKELHEHLPQEAQTFTHSDLKADHMLVTPNGLSLIDFDTCSLTDPAFDVGKFLADLDWWHALYGKQDIKQDIKDAHEPFLAGYFRDIPQARLSRARLYEALILSRIVTRRAPLFSKDWPELTLRLLHQSEGILDSNFS